MVELQAKLAEEQNLMITKRLQCVTMRISYGLRKNGGRGDSSTFCTKEEHNRMEEPERGQNKGQVNGDDNELHTRNIQS